MRFPDDFNTCAGMVREKIQTFEKFKLSVCDDQCPGEDVASHQAYSGSSRGRR